MGRRVRDLLIADPSAALQADATHLSRDCRLTRRRLRRRRRREWPGVAPSRRGARGNHVPAQHLADALGRLVCQVLKERDRLVQERAHHGRHHRVAADPLVPRHVGQGIACVVHARDRAGAALHLGQVDGAADDVGEGRCVQLPQLGRRRLRRLLEDVRRELVGVGAGGVDNCAGAFAQLALGDEERCEKVDLGRPLMLALLGSEGLQVVLLVAEVGAVLGLQVCRGLNAVGEHVVLSTEHQLDTLGCRRLRRPLREDRGRVRTVASGRQVAMLVGHRRRVVPEEDPRLVAAVAKSGGQLKSWWWCVHHQPRDAVDVGGALQNRKHGVNAPMRLERCHRRVMLGQLHREAPWERPNPVQHLPRDAGGQPLLRAPRD